MKRVKVETAIIAGAIGTIAIGIGVCNTLSSLTDKYESSLKQIDELNIKIEQQQSEIQNANDLYNQVLNEKQEIESQLSKTTKELENARRKIEKYTRVTCFNEYNLTQLSHASVVHMKKALKGTKLQSVASSFVEAEETYGVNAYFLAAIAALESSWGTSNRAMYQNNLTGHAVYNNSARGTYFNSWHESIMTTAKMLKENYLSPDGIYYNGLSTVDVNKKYCFLQDEVTIDYNWSSSVNSIANSLKYKGNE